MNGTREDKAQPSATRKQTVVVVLRFTVSTLVIELPAVQNPIL
jgi:hypothetical protein